MRPPPTFLKFLNFLKFLKLRVTDTPHLVPSCMPLDTTLDDLGPILRLGGQEILPIAA